MTSTPAADRAARRLARKNDPDRLSAWTTVTWTTTGVSAAINFIVVGYVVFYGTDVLGLPAALMGTLALVSKLLEAGVAIFAGWLVDRSPETRWGKARPYELAIVGVWAATWMLFSVPDMGTVWQAVWLLIALILVNVVFTTLLGANDLLYLARTFRSRVVITKVSTRTGFFTVLGVVAANAVLPILISQVGTSAPAWSVMVLFISIPMAIVGLGRFFFNKERYKTEGDEESKVRFADIREVLSTNRYLWVVAGITFLANAAGGSGVLVYYFQYIVGDVALMSVVAVVPLLVLPSMLAYPWLMKRIGVGRIIGYSAMIGVVGGLLLVVAGGSVLLVFVGWTCSGLALLPITFLGPLLVIDNAAFNQWSGRRRLESTMGAINALAQRLAGGISLGVAGWVLGFVGYDGTLAVQPVPVLAAIVVLMGAVPAVLWIGVMVLVRPYRKLELMLPTITQELAIVLAADPAADEPVVVQPAAHDQAAEKIVHDQVRHAESDERR